MNNRDEKENKNTKEDKNMASIAKPSTRAFTLNAEKRDVFLKRTENAKKASERFEKHTPKVGVRTPHKGISV